VQAQAADVLPGGGHTASRATHHHRCAVHMQTGVRGGSCGGDHRTGVSRFDETLHGCSGASCGPALLVAPCCCILLLYAAASCCSTLLHLVAPCCCILLLYAAASCCSTLLHLVAPCCCILLLYAAASCCSTLLHLVAPCCCILLLTTVTGVRAEGGGEGGGGDAGRAEKGEGLDEAVEGTQHGLPSAAHVV
jgi:hypothetical protein